MKNILTQNLSKYFLPGASNNSNALLTSSPLSIEPKNVNVLNATRNSIKMITHFFSPINALASKPVFTVTTKSVIVHVFYFIPAAPNIAKQRNVSREQALNNNTVNNLGNALRSLFGRSVELRLVKLHYPYLNRYILAQYIALNTQDHTLVQIVRRIFGSFSPVKKTSTTPFSSQENTVDILNKTVIDALNSSLPLPAYLQGAVVGIKVRVSGRLMAERSRPRQTVQTAEIGSFSKNNLSFVDKASFTSKNKKGAFTVKVWISQLV